MALPALMRPLRGVGRCARALTHPGSARARVLATAVRPGRRSAGNRGT